MLLLTIRTDKPDAELGLFSDEQQLAYDSWEAHRQLAETIHLRIRHMLTDHGHTMQDLEGLVVFKGPGSFTGLRIGLTVANAMAQALQVPIVATNGEQWRELGIARLQHGDNETIALPEYGGEPHITQQKK
ncbi:MAG TPA: tRNA (adenosine(37)-N6)-threonylcarbamoyltransferase complex dimerization subunit type 1 TsaB [Candidatus Saccharimonadales bacterium]|nr:tRNA (adenosine(37)-N6)-threonylcarbamoyltransferase complex dimerization subunit type 1 TsaB [Candidatus Saccharimonadales bacterium]